MTIGRRFTAKSLALLLSTATLAELMHIDYEHWNARGRDAYLASKVTYFDKNIATVQPLAITFLILLILAGAFILFYELLQLAFKLLMDKATS